MAKKRPKTLEHEYASMQHYDYEQREGETDLQYYRRLAKTADQRLVRLEALRHDPDFKGIEKFAYARALRDIESYGGKKRFNTKPPTARSLFNEKIADMIRFLKSPTSMKEGIVEVYKKRADTLNEMYGTNFTWKTLSNVIDSGELEKLKADYGSDTVFQSIGTVTKNKAQIEKMMEDAQAPEKKGEHDLVNFYGIATDSPLDQSVESILENKELMNILLRS